MMTEEEQPTTEDRIGLMPTAPFTVTLRSGRQVTLEELPDKIFSKFAYNQLRKLRKQIYALCAFKIEADKRELKIVPYDGYSIFQMSTHATILAVNNFNTHYDGGFDTAKKGDEEE